MCRKFLAVPQSTTTLPSWLRNVFLPIPQMPTQRRGRLSSLYSLNISHTWTNMRSYGPTWDEERDMNCPSVSFCYKQQISCVRNSPSPIPRLKTQWDRYIGSHNNSVGIDYFLRQRIRDYLNNKKREKKPDTSTEIPHFTGRSLYGSRNREFISQELTKRNLVDNESRLAAWPNQLSLLFNSLTPQAREEWERQADEINTTGGSDEDKQA